MQKTNPLAKSSDLSSLYYVKYYKLVINSQAHKTSQLLARLIRAQ